MAAFRKSYLLTLIFLFAIVTGLLSGCGGGSPGKVVEEYRDALKAGNFKKAWKLVSEDSRLDIAGPSAAEGLKKFQEKNEEALKDEKMKNQLSGTKVTNEKIEGSHAIVTVEFTGDSGKPSTQDIQLVKEEGKWKIRF